MQELIEPESAAPGSAVPPHLVVAVEPPPHVPSDAQSAARVRILPRYVRRVVWGKPSGRGLEPGTLWFRDGRRVTYQSLRWQRDGVRVLSDDGVRAVAFSELAEVRCPAATRGRVIAKSWRPATRSCRSGSCTWRPRGA